MLWRMYATALCGAVALVVALVWPSSIWALIALIGLVGLQGWLLRGLWRTGMREHTRD